jgi:hypothetical protein
MIRRLKGSSRWEDGFCQRTFRTRDKALAHLLRKQTALPSGPDGKGHVCHTPLVDVKGTKVRVRT